MPLIMHHVLIMLCTYIILNSRLFQDVFKQCPSRLLSRWRWVTTASQSWQNALTRILIVILSENIWAIAFKLGMGVDLCMGYNYIDGHFDDLDLELDAWSQWLGRSSQSVNRSGFHWYLVHVPVSVCWSLQIQSVGQSVRLSLVPGICSSFCVLIFAGKARPSWSRTPWHTSETTSQQVEM